MADEAKLCSPILQILKCLCDMLSGVVMEKNCALSFDQCWLQAFQFLLHLINCWTYFSVVMVSPGTESCRRQEQQQTHKQWPWPFFGASLALESTLELLLGPTTELIITGCHIKSSFCGMPQSSWEMVHCCCTEWEKTTVQNDDFFLFVVSSWGTHLLSFFTFPICCRC